MEGCDLEQQRTLAQDIDWQRIITREGAHEINYEIQDKDLVPDFLDDEWLNEEEIRLKCNARNETMQRHEKLWQIQMHNDLLFVILVLL